MPAAVAPLFGIDDFSIPNIRISSAGWIGSAAGTHDDLITIDSNGFITEAVAAGNAVGSTTKVGFLGQDVASSVAAASAAALAVQFRAPQETTEVELSVVNNSDTLITPTAAMEGDTIGLYRRSTGEYVADTNGSTHLFVKRANIARGTVIGIIVPALRV